MITKETLKAYQRAFDNFREDTKAVESTILKSTETNGCSLELFEDATYHILCDAEIGNSYNGTGIIISIPKLDCDDYDGKDGQHLFDNAIEEMDWLWETTIKNYLMNYLTLLSDNLNYLAELRLL